MPAKFTNKHNIPESIARAIMVDDHVTLGDISVTSLIDSPKIFRLKKQNEYEMDIMDLIPAFMGTGLHTALERAEKGNYKTRILRQAAGVFTELGKPTGAESIRKVIAEIGEDSEDYLIKEKTWTIEINGWTISGTVDQYNKQTAYIEDFKMCKASAFMFPEFKKSWEYQMNCYSAMLREAGYEVKGAVVHAFFKDWSAAKVLSNRDYPATIYMRVEIPVHSQEKVLEYMTQRVLLHQKVASGIDVPCTGKDRWEDATTYAIMKKGGKRAIKRAESHQAAQGLLEQMAHKYEDGAIFVETRPGKAKRCEEYCPVRNLCDQYKADIAKQALEAEEM